MSDSTSKKIPAIVLGGTGYVSGELIRLILGHPNYALTGIMSDSSPGELAARSFPHLAGALGASPVALSSLSPMIVVFHTKRYVTIPSEACHPA